MIKEHLIEVRKHILAAFDGIPKPARADVYDPSPGGPDTVFYRNLLAEKDWSQLAVEEARHIYGGTLNEEAYAYYLQALLVGNWPERPLGLPPEEAWLAGVDVSPWTPYSFYDSVSAYLNSRQLDAIATYVLFHAQIGDEMAALAYNEYWRQFVLKDGILNKIEQSSGSWNLKGGFA